MYIDSALSCQAEGPDQERCLAVSAAHRRAGFDLGDHGIARIPTG
jgi:hypothetical protein